MKISEIMTLADGCKTALGESFSDEGSLPDNDVDGGTIPQQLAFACVESIGFSDAVGGIANVDYTRGDSDTATVTVTLAGITALPAANNTLAFVYDGEGPIFGYNCASGGLKKGIAAAGTTVEDKYLPTACRSVAP